MNSLPVPDYRSFRGSPQTGVGIPRLNGTWERCPPILCVEIGGDLYANRYAAPFNRGIFTPVTSATGSEWHLAQGHVFSTGRWKRVAVRGSQSLFQQAVPPLFGGGFLLTVGGISLCGMGGEKRLRKPVYLLRNETIQQKQRANTQKIINNLGNI